MNQHWNHKLSWERAPTSLGEITQALGETAGTSPGCFDEILAGNQEWWPGRQNQMARMSTRWPNTIFVLDLQPTSGMDDPPIREYYWNGLVQAVAAELVFPRFNPREMEEPQKLATQDKGGIRQTALPEHPERCQGPDSGFHQLEEVHFLDSIPGMIVEPIPPEELFYTELDDPDCRLTGSGFFCMECLQTAGTTPAGRITLQQEMERRGRRQQQYPTCTFQPCTDRAVMTVLYPSPEDYWALWGNLCGGHFGMLIWEGRIPRNWRAHAAGANPGEIRAGQDPYPSS